MTSICKRCGKPYQTKTEISQYCGTSCRVMACRDRKRGIVRTAPTTPKRSATTEHEPHEEDDWTPRYNPETGEMEYRG